jgi:cell division protein FtsW
MLSASRAASALAGGGGVSEVRRGFHGGVVSACALLCATGLVMIYSVTAARTGEGGIPGHFLRQFGGALLGLGVVFVASRVPLAAWRRAALPLWTASLVLLIATQIVGAEVNGARRWLPFFGFTFQPGELAKWSTLLFAAALLAAHPGKRRGDSRGARSEGAAFAKSIKTSAFWRPGPSKRLAKRSRADSKTKGIPQSNGASPRSLWLTLVIGVGCPTLLLFLQPDTSGALLILVMVALLVFVAGAPPRALFATGAAGALALAAAALARPYVLERLYTYLDPWARPEAEGFQIVQSFVAFGRGGAFGVGLGSGRQKLFYLPEPHTDFVLSVVGEELGLVGVALVLGAFAALVVAGFQIAMRASTRYGLLLAFAMTIAIAVPAALNAAVVTGLAPATGLALPFVSYGRTSLLISFLAVGVLLSVARTDPPRGSGAPSNPSGG